MLQPGRNFRNGCSSKEGLNSAVWSPGILPGLLCIQMTNQHWRFTSLCANFCQPTKLPTHHQKSHTLQREGDLQITWKHKKLKYKSLNQRKHCSLKFKQFFFKPRCTYCHFQNYSCKYLVITTTERQLISFNCWIKACGIFKISGFTLLTQRVTINRW